jgi:glycosyltransferase involved in cell wall biosynthesis
MNVGYLTNVYPKPSHSFIRREIAAVEACGMRVFRYSIRPGEPVVDPADVAEGARTSVILDVGAPRLLAACLAVASRRPRAFLRALSLAITVWRRSGRGLVRHLAYLAEACLLVGWLRRDGVGHLHAHFGSNPAAVAMLCRELGGPPYSFTGHGIETFDAPEFISLDEKIGRSAFTVAVSQFGRSQMWRWSAPDHWSRVHVVRCGVDQQFLDSGPTPVPDVARLVCVARLSAEKGHLPLLRGAAVMKESGRRFELVLVGDGPLRPSVEAEIERLGLGGHVRLAGWLSGAEVIEAIRGARALVLPSFTEGLPVVLMEALALGRPAVATHITGVPELVEDGTTGWLVPAGSDTALAAAMAAALDTPVERLREMGLEGHRRVAAAHDAGVEGRRMAALFRASAQR